MKEHLGQGEPYHVVASQISPSVLVEFIYDEMPTQLPWGDGAPRDAHRVDKDIALCETKDDASVVKCVDKIACNPEVLVHERNYPCQGLPIACPLDEWHTCWVSSADGEYWVTGEIYDNVFYYTSDSGQLLLITCEAHAGVVCCPRS